MRARRRCARGAVRVRRIGSKRTQRGHTGCNRVLRGHPERERVRQRAVHPRACRLIPQLVHHLLDREDLPAERVQRDVLDKPGRVNDQHVRHVARRHGTRRGGGRLRRLGRFWRGRPGDGDGRAPRTVSNRFGGHGGVAACHEHDVFRLLHRRGGRGRDAWPTIQTTVQ